MPSETKTTKNSITNVSLKEYFDMRFTNLEASLNERFIAQERATKIANEAANKRLEGMNEFKESLRDQASKFVTRNELNSANALINEKLDGICREIKSIQISDATLAGKASQTQVIIAYIISILGIIFGIINIVTK